MVSANVRVVKGVAGSLDIHRQGTASMSRCCGTELKKPTRSSLVACNEMSGGVWVR